MKSETEIGLEWISLGPVVNSARVESVQADPNKPGTLYAAFGSGNLWKTTNNGNHWKPIFEDQAALGIGDIALAPSNPSIIYLGSGESLKKARNFTMPGTGVYRSDDGGESWKHLGLTDSWHIGEISIHPNNPDIVLVAVMGHFWSTNKNRGIYRTEDGGKNWEHVLYLDEKTAANDIVISPSNPNYVYASMWENNPGIYGPNTGIYTSRDGGKNWERCTDGLPEGSQTGRTGLAVSYQNPLKAYALIDNLNKNKQRSAEVYRTEDGGKSWRKMHEEDLLFFPGIGWYFTDIYVNPKDDEEIFGLGVRLAHSTDGGRSFEYLGGDVFHMFPSAADHLHLDHCELWINPQNPEHILLGNDGGLYQSFDKGKSWFHFNNIPAGEFYQLTVDNQKPYNIYAGAQDDATVVGTSREWNPAFQGHWKYLWIDAWSGGDGCYTQVDPEDPNTVYFSLQNGYLMRKDMKTDRSKPIPPRLSENSEDRLAYNFVAPYLISPHNSNRLYLGGNYVWKTENRGDSWSRISPDISISALEEKKSEAAGAITESHMEEGLLYVGTDKGSFWTTKDDGENWQEYSTNLPNAYIRSIYPSRHKKSRVYLALNGMNYDDLNGYLFVSDNYGKKWKSIRSNLPNETANVILEDPRFENILYAGLYRGAYISLDRGKSWQLLGRNLSAMAVADMIIHEESADLIIATHGRGIYRTNLKPLYEFLESNNTNEPKLCSPDTLVRPRYNDTHRDPNYKSLEPGSFTYYIPESGELNLSIRDEREGVLWSESLTGKKGLNQLRWDLIVKKEKSLNPYFIHYDNFIEKGTYRLVLSWKDKAVEQSLII
ncbi:MAG: hypothetical protein AAFR87_27080, partial [Bacteroidota bacterium]